MTTIAVSDETARMLAALKKSLKVASLDECIRKLVAVFKKETAVEESMFGAARGRIDTKGLRDHYEHRF